jgi:THO complex subunit 7
MATTVAVTEEEIIRRRLLFDGDGTGDDKRITTILKTIIKWSSTPYDDEERNLHYQKILALLDQAEYSMTKHHFSYLMNIKERENYEQLFLNIKQQIVDAKQDIAECKVQLQDAKVVRKNKQEYDALAKIIEKHPERKVTNEEIADLETNINELNSKKQTLLQKLSMRQKQFHVLIYSVQLLQQILQEDEDINDISVIESKSTDPKKVDQDKVVEVMDLT